MFQSCNRMTHRISYNLYYIEVKQGVVQNKIVLSFDDKLIKQMCKRLIQVTGSAMMIVKYKGFGNIFIKLGTNDRFWFRFASRFKAVDL